MAEPIVGKPYSKEATTIIQLPSEMLFAVLSLLEKDSDVFNFGASCKKFYGLIRSGDSPIWKDRFNYSYDPAELSMNIRETFLARKELMRLFSYGEEDLICSKSYCAVEAIFYRFIKKLVLECVGIFNRTASGALVVAGKNHACLQQIVEKTFVVFRPGFSQSGSSQYERNVCMLALFSWSIKAPLFMSFISMPDAQRTVYSSPHRAPLFFREGEQNLNMKWLLSAMVFWHFHLTNPQEGGLYYGFWNRLPEEKPQYPVKVLGEPCMLGKHWRGYYALLQPGRLFELRRSRLLEDIYMDNFGCEEDGEMMTLEFERGPLKEDWTEERMTNYLSNHFANILPSQVDISSGDEPSQLINYSDLGSFVTFHGRGVDPKFENFLFEGRVYPLGTQSGYPGFQRLVMLQYFNPTHNIGAPESLWYWEACVLPGGQFMIGRYYSGPLLEQEQELGPLILWQIFPPAIASAPSNSE